MEKKFFTSLHFEMRPRQFHWSLVDVTKRCEEGVCHGWARPSWTSDYVPWRCGQTDVTVVRLMDLRARAKVTVEYEDLWIS